MMSRMRLLPANVIFPKKWKREFIINPWRADSKRKSLKNFSIYAAKTSRIKRDDDLADGGVGRSLGCHGTLWVECLVDAAAGKISRCHILCKCHRLFCDGCILCAHRTA